MRVLVTGATGFLGSNLVRALRARGDEVLGFGRDLDPDGIRGSELGAVHHLAFDAPALATREGVELNVAMAVGVAESAIDAGARRIVLASSGFVYGQGRKIPIPEDHPLEPETANGVAKLRTEEALAAICARRGVPLTVLRYANLYGGGERDRSVIARFVAALVEGRPVRIAGRGAQTRDFVHVDDAVAASLAVMVRELGGTFNVGTGVETSMLGAWDVVQEVLGRRGTIEWVPRRPDDRPRNALEGTPLRRAAGLPDPIPLREGVRRSWVPRRG